MTETHRVQIDQKDTTVVVVDDGSVDSAAAVVVEVDVDLVLSSAQNEKAEVLGKKSLQMIFETVTFKFVSAMVTTG